MKKFTVKEGHEVRGMMIRLYPDAEQIEALHALECDSRIAWNWLVRQVQETIDAREAYAVKQGLVGPRLPAPVYEGLGPAEAKAKKEAFAKACKERGAAIYAATKDDPACSYRKLSEYLSHFGKKQDYQLMASVINWGGRANDGRKIRPGAHMLQSLVKNYYQKSARRKRKRKSHEAMPLQVRSGVCFELGKFGARGRMPANQEGPPQNFYDCRIKINGLTIRGRLPGKAPSGRVLQGVSVTRQADGWWASIKQEVPVRAISEAEPGTVVGIDVGLDYIAAFSDPAISAVKNPRDRAFAEQVAGRQAIATTLQGERRKRYENRTARLQLRAARATKHTIHTEILKPLESVETIKIEKLVATIGQMGSSKVSVMRLVAQMLTNRFGQRVREVDCRYTSQDCSQCGHRSKMSWSYEHGRIGKCNQCGYSADRDINAARNIAARPALSLGS